jgi:hypothetical protein
MQISNNKPNNQPHAGQPGTTGRYPHSRPRETTSTSPFPQTPNSAPTTHTSHPGPFHPHPPEGDKEYWTPGQPPRIAIVSVPPTSNTAAGHMPTKRRLDQPIKRPAGQKLLRKEVIQPHLPVRLPCYDFVPIADPTFDSSLPTRGLSHWLRVLPTFVT